MWARAVVLSVFTACTATPVSVTELRVRDPWQIDLEDMDGRVLLPPLVVTAPRGCAIRDDEGFPHYSCAGGHFHIEDDGALVITGDRPIIRNGKVLAAVDLYREKTCWRRGRGNFHCTRPAGKMIFATPVTNVTSLGPR